MHLFITEPIHVGSPFPTKIFSRLLLVSVTLGMAGCGGSQPNETIVSPAEVRSTADQPTNEPAVQAPGAMELPADLVPESAPKTEPKSGGGFEMPTSVENSSSSSATQKPTEIQYASWEAIQKNASSSGKLTVVDLWSLSCEPCLKEFPELVRLYKASGDNIHCVAVNLDFDGRKTRPPEHYQTQVASFLESVSAEDLPIYICDTPSDDVFAAADIDSIPTVLIYNADGKLVKKFVDSGETHGFTYQKDILPLLETLSN